MKHFSRCDSLKLSDKNNSPVDYIVVGWDRAAVSEGGYSQTELVPSILIIVWQRSIQNSKIVSHTIFKTLQNLREGLTAQ